MNSGKTVVKIACVDRRSTQKVASMPVYYSPRESVPRVNDPRRSDGYIGVRNQDLSMACLGGGIQTPLFGIVATSEGVCDNGRHSL